MRLAMVQTSLEPEDLEEPEKPRSQEEEDDLELFGGGKAAAAAVFAKQHKKNVAKHAKAKAHAVKARAAAAMATAAAEAQLQAATVDELKELCKARNHEDWEAGGTKAELIARLV